MRLRTGTGLDRDKMVDTNEDLNNDDENHGQQQQEVEQQRPAAGAVIADFDSDSDSDSDSNSDDDEDNDNGDDDEDNAEEEEEDDEDSDDESTVAADTMIVRANRRAKLRSLLALYDDCPLRTRNNIDDLVAESLERAEDDAHDMLCDQNDGDNYRGLDCERDTIKEVRTIVKIFPNLLSKRKDMKWGTNENGEQGWINAENGEGEYPIHCLMYTYGPNGCRYNLKALPFVATLAQLGKNLDQFEEERGGLLIEDEHGWNTLQYLAIMPDSSDEEEYNQRMDTVCLSQFIQLQRMGLFKLEDIPRYELLHNLCYQDHFSENTFQFLVEWYPTSLVLISEDGWLPLHIAAFLTIQAFRIVFEYAIRYYPNKKGITILFTKNNRSMTPFQIACEKHGRDVVMRIVENTLNNSDIPIKTVEALIMAAINGNIHFDCSYLLLRREPELLVRLLSGPNTNNNDDGSGGSGGGGHHNDDNEDDDDDDHLDDIDVDKDNADDDKEDMNDDDDTDDDDDRNCSRSDIFRNNMNRDKVEEGDRDDDDDKMGDGTNNNEVVSRKRKR